MVEIGNVPDSTAAARFPRWKEGTRSSDGFAYTSPVGRFLPNNFGLYDTLGNVFEWCSDWDDPNFYHHSPRNDPQGPPSGSMRIARGGSFVALVPVHGRWAFSPELHLPDLGFRVAREIPGSPSIPPATSQELAAPSAGPRGSRRAPSSLGEDRVRLAADFPVRAVSPC
jgi:sulfatase modifying factor 1